MTQTTTRKVTTREEARDLVTISFLSPSCKQVMQNAIYGTYTRDTDDAERTVKMNMTRLFKGVDVKPRRQYAILEELRGEELITSERYAGKITYSLNLNPLRTVKWHTKSLSVLELGIAMRKPITIEAVRSWAAAA